MARNRTALQGSFRKIIDADATARVCVSQEPAMRHRHLLSMFAGIGRGGCDDTLRRR